MKSKWILLLALLPILLSLSSCMVFGDVLAVSSPEIDETILDFPIALITGETTSLREHQGKTVLLVFFSVHCGHCHNESSHLEAIYQEYKEQDFTILSAEVSGADPTALADFAAQYGITYPLGADPDAQFARYMEVTGVPHNLLIDRNGTVAGVIRGFSNAQNLRTEIEKLLASQ